MARTRKADREEYVRRHMYEYADSGLYSGWLAIERHFREQGKLEARQILDDRDIRAELDRRCKAARAKPAP